jgi:hypothetical protein
VVQSLLFDLDTLLDGVPVFGARILLCVFVNAPERLRHRLIKRHAFSQAARHAGELSLVDTLMAACTVKRDWCVEVDRGL